MTLIQCTQRESEVLVLLAHGHSNKTIALRLGISPHTVRDHVCGLIQRHGLSNRVQLATFASARAWKVAGAEQHYRLTSPPPAQLPLASEDLALHLHLRD
jgi:DNA-binding CsgD family transcriptional regulator